MITETNLIKTEYRKHNETINSEIDITKYIPTLLELDEMFSKVPLRKVVYDGKTYPIFEIKKVTNNYGIEQRYINNIEIIASRLNAICVEAFTNDHFDSGACVIGMETQIKVVYPRKRKSETITLIRQYGQGEGFNYVYQKRIIQMINSYMPNLSKFVVTSCGRMD